ncbi:hypothetical protein GCM10009735_82230 [Actinomadura chokoriensis]
MRPDPDGELSVPLVLDEAARVTGAPRRTVERWIAAERPPAPETTAPPTSWRANCPPPTTATAMTQLRRHHGTPSGCRVLLVDRLI